MKKKILTWLVIMVWLLSGCGTSSPGAAASDRLTFSYVQVPQQENPSEITEDQDNASETDSATEEPMKMLEQHQKMLAESLCITSFAARFYY